MLNSPVSLSRSARMLLAALSVAVVSGCATNYPSGSSSDQPRYVLNNDAAKPIQDESLNGFLAQAPAGGILNLVRSPWGDNVEVVADEPYLAASGRACRRLSIIDASGASRRGLACETSNGWVDQRVITQSLEGRN
ncbi:DVU3141 family protein [Vreelandella olivaria]|uniref:DVU3141 family protein n=1 Tax=Vreelandella olivaria TaxID=390919 RepID=UPI00201F09C9|nr:DVU3141 family protein [Halomonas olivaria]